MARRHVQWAPQELNVYYSPAPSSSYTTSTPSPVFSDTSLPSSDGVHTPPLNSTTPLTGQTYIHRALFGGMGYQAGIVYDVTQHPSTARLAANFPEPSRDVEDILQEPATYPGSATMTITTPLLPYKIEVAPRSLTHPYSPSKQDCARFITVRDVLAAIHDSVMMNMKDADLANALATAPPEVRAYAVAAHHARAGQVGYRADQMRRADFLGVHTTFQGIGLSGKKWTITLGPRW